jgi:hypothetical protein
MVRTLRALIAGAAVCAAGLLPAGAQGEKKSEIKGGIEATVKKVDADKGTLTVTTPDGKEHTFTVTDDTTIVGPRGGVARRRLNDPRFRPGFDVTVVASGTAAKEVHLGYARKGEGETPAPAKATAKGKARPIGPAVPSKAKGTPAAGTDEAANPAKGAAAKQAEAEEDEQEFPGKVKSVDPARRVLVVTLLNGKDRSFLLPKDFKVAVKGSASTITLESLALNAGAPVTVLTEPGGRKVKEVRVTPMSAIKGKKAG